MEIFDKLIGSRLISLDNDRMVVEKDGKTYNLDFVLYQGGCICSYANITNTLLYDVNSETNPVITKVEVNDEDKEADEREITVTLFGMNKAIATIEAEAGSGSGWYYGACVTVECKDLDIDDELVCY